MINGCDNWEVIIGQFGVHFDVSTMWRYNAAPMKGFIDAMLIIGDYLNHHIKLHVICDTIFLEDQVEVDL